MSEQFPKPRSPIERDEKGVEAGKRHLLEALKYARAGDKPRMEDKVERGIKMMEAAYPNPMPHDKNVELESVINQIHKEFKGEIGSNSIEPYDPENPDLGFSDWLEKNNVKIFDRFADCVYETLQGLQSVGEKRRIPEFMKALYPPKKPLEKPMSREELNDSAQILSKLRNYEKGQPGDDTVNIFLRGLSFQKESQAREQPTRRKLYVNPPLDKAAAFAQNLYAILSRERISINGSKIHTEGAHDEHDRFIAQGHNTFVIYLVGDTEIPMVLKAVEEAERATDICLNTYQQKEVKKTPVVLNGKVIVGGPDHGNYSFDKWTDSVAGGALFAWEKDSTISREQVHEIMKKKLSVLFHKSPEHYLSTEFND